MNNITFEHIHILGHIINDNEMYRQYHYPEMLNRYDSNFIQWKKMPTLTQFKEIELAIHTFHKANNQQHMKFIFPANIKILDEITTYLSAESYQIGYLELYAIQPSTFTVAKIVTIDVQQVTDSNLEDFLKLQYDEDLKYGESFAKDKQQLLLRQFNDRSKQQVIAYFEGIPAGSAEIIVQAETVEIDNIFVVKALQRKGIGGQIQRFVMDNYEHKTVLLLADGEDTAREMYQKQNYVYQGYRFEVLKVEN
ncbi:GNAT family N-acetyltransferase [Paenibacillus endoradicis]|uniref:GNAT family N-acetyltransferase n=1 Tax=Paenibacillus endoradicis TaxID=2972487 RepID=UPI0021597075|nr:GNAT family N-acetyltransferase [Paenibacillus endoradicis]MCR8657677.1 GNAT family N-acetyltransferase [Paenibacillus endoradicis]